MSEFIDVSRGEAPPSVSGNETPLGVGPNSSLTRWMAAAVLIFGLGLGLGLTPQVAQAAHAATVPPPSGSTPPTSLVVTTPADCSVEIAIDQGNPAPSSTLPGTCLISAARGEYPAVAGASGEAPADLPRTGSSTHIVAALAACLLAAGFALWFVARRPRAG